jgi:hypothetical protein
MDIELTSDMLWWIGFLIPVVTAALVKLNPDGSQAKSPRVVLAIVFTTAVAVLQESLRDKLPGDTWSVNAYVDTWVKTFVLQLVAYLGIWKPKTPILAPKEDAVPLAGRFGLIA